MQFLQFVYLQDINCMCLNPRKLLDYVCRMSWLQRFRGDLIISFFLCVVWKHKKFKGLIVGGTILNSQTQSCMSSEKARVSTLKLHVYRERCLVRTTVSFSKKCRAFSRRYCEHYIEIMRHSMGKMHVFTEKRLPVTEQPQYFTEKLNFH